MSYNKITILGYVGSDPQSRQVGENTVTSFSIATSEKSGGEEKTTWFRVNAWNKLAELVNNHVKKGSQLYIEGRLTLNEFKDKDGNNRTSAEVRLSELQFAGSKPVADDAPKAKAAGVGAVDDSSIPF